MSSPTSRPTPALRADLVLAGVTVIWGSSFVVVRRALDDSPPLGLLFYRFLLASVLLGVAVIGRERPRGIARDGVVLGLLLAAGLSFQVLGQTETTASNAAFLTGLAVVLTPFVAVFRTRRLPTIENGVGITLASGGFFLLTFPAGGGSVGRGDLLVSICGVVFAFYGVELAERGGRHDALWLTTIQLCVVAAVAGILLLVVRTWMPSGTHLGILEARPIPWQTTFLWNVLYLGSVATVVAFLGWTWAQGRMSAVHGAILLALEPVFAALFAAWFLHERLGTRGIAGGALVLTGIVVSELKLRKSNPLRSDL